MKSKLFFILSVSILLSSCNTDKKIEVIPDYNSIYLTSTQLNEQPKLIQGVVEKLWNDVKEFIKAHPEEKYTGQSLEYNLFLNESGSIEKLQIVKSMSNSIDELVLNKISNWKFKPGMKNGVAVKSQYNIRFYNGAETNFNNQETYLLAAEVMPEIVGGFNAIIEKLKYPQEAKQAGIQGKVFVLALIDEEGNVDGAKVIKGIGYGCDEAALNAVKSVKFTPALTSGKPVKVQVTIPIFFKLENSFNF